MALSPCWRAQDSASAVRRERPAKSRLSLAATYKPILAEHCLACHGADENSREADLRLDVRDEAVDYGAIVPGEPDDSELLYRVLTDDPDLVMPPEAIKKPLDDEQKELLRRWIAEGAEYEQHWSFIAPAEERTSGG